MVEYCCFTYTWLGQGWTQEINRLQQKKTRMTEWEGRYWVDFLNQMAKQGWEIETILPLGDRESLEQGAVAYLKRYSSDSASDLGGATGTDSGAG